MACSRPALIYDKASWKTGVWRRPNLSLSAMAVCVCVCTSGSPDYAHIQRNHHPAIWHSICLWPMSCHCQNPVFSKSKHRFNTIKLEWDASEECRSPQTQNLRGWALPAGVLTSSSVDTAMEELRPAAWTLLELAATGDTLQVLIVCFWGHFLLSQQAGDSLGFFPSMEMASFSMFLRSF